MANNDSQRSTWNRIKLVVKVIEVRLRFVAILVATALLIGYWDTIHNYWDKWTRPAVAASGAVTADQEFYCPMHPQVVRDRLEPNGEVPKCPICGMPLSLRQKGQSSPLPQGVTARVQLSPDRIQLAGIETAEVKYLPLRKEITTVGNVTYDESRLSRVVSRVSGYIEKLYINKTFTLCKKGDPLAAIYSPDLYNASQELLLTARSPTGLNLTISARQRLKLLGVDDAEIDQIVKAGKVETQLLIRSPQSGYVIAKDIVEGAQVEPGTTLMEVADLSTVWIEAEVFENDTPLVYEGQRIEAEVESLPGRTFKGTVSLVYPRVETATRTVGVRFVVENPQNDLRPGMFATVRLGTPLAEIEPFASLKGSLASGTPSAGEVLAVPERAVIDTGTKQVVYVERQPGLFEGVEVQLGPRAGAMYPVIRGLQAGDRVAAAGAFLIDAETRLNPAAAATYFGASGGPQASAIRPTGPATMPTAESAPAPDAAAENFADLSPEDRKLAVAQGVCPISGSPLGSMGPPVKIVVKGQTVFLCCSGCTEEATNNPKKTLKKVAELKEARKRHPH